MARMFGTDGVRGVANTELTVELAMGIGRATAMVLAEEVKRPKVLIGMDTRASGNMFESALAAGLCSVGADAVLAGVVPTPAVAYLVQKYGCDAGIMISASHNPCEYNGIKLFSGDGYKLPDEIEDKIENIVTRTDIGHPAPTHGDVGRVSHAEDAAADYVEYVISTTDLRFDGMKIALDCANGSSSVTAKVLFTMLGAEVHVMSDTPDGVNINDGCGSTHMENLQKYVRENGMDGGFAFDGDADRCLAVDENGELIDGDKIIAICALDLKARGQLKDNKAVVTVMSNLGFFRFADDNGIIAEKTKVGDRYVLECMKENDLAIGGEQSGHVIFYNLATTGDGQLTAVQFLAAVKRAEKPFSELAKVMTVYPQVLKNIVIDNDKKDMLFEDEDIKKIIFDTEVALGDNGRVLVRASGTEPLVRVMLEGKDISVIEEKAMAISNVIADRLNGKIKA